MTEAEWLTCANPTPMLQYLREKASDRKLRLFAVACCRRVWDVMTDEAGRMAVEFAERFADRGATAKELRKAAVAAARATADHDPGSGLDEYRVDQALSAAVNAAGRRPRLGYAAECAADAAEDEAAERAAQGGLLREVFGNPFRPVTADPRWLTITTVALATHIYAERAFDRLPILADALEEAGCDDPDVLTHLRGDGPHVRGCWVVDLLLGKE